MSMIGNPNFRGVDNCSCRTQIESWYTRYTTPQGKDLIGIYLDETHLYLRRYISSGSGSDDTSTVFQPGPSFPQPDSQPDPRHLYDTFLSYHMWFRNNRILRTFHSATAFPQSPIRRPYPTDLGGRSCSCSTHTLSSLSSSNTDAYKWGASRERDSRRADSRVAEPQRDGESCRSAYF